jgi:hypothetical protein
MKYSTGLQIPTEGPILLEDGSGGLFNRGE